MNTTSSVGHIIKDYRPIGVNYINPIEPIGAPNSYQTVETLLEECSDIIDQRYKPWFAKRLYRLNKNSVLTAAKLARQDGKNPHKYFSQMIKDAPGEASHE